MTIFFWSPSGLRRILFALAIVLSASMASSADDALGFADRLFAEGDYFRAIGEYKRVRYSSDEPEIDWLCSARIADSFRLSGKYESSLSELYRLGDPDSLPIGKKEWSLTSFALNYYGLRLIPNAMPYLDRAIDLEPASSAMPSLYRGLLFAEIAKWENAMVDFERALGIADSADDGDGEAMVETARFSLETIRAVPRLPRRSPIAAAGLSALMPGLGQLYSGHWFDALQAFGTVGAFVLATSAAFLYEHDNDGTFLYTGLLAAVTFSLHSSNIFGAYKTAQYFNAKRVEESLAPIRSAILDLEVPSPAANGD